MRTELDRRPLVPCLAGLAIGLSAPIYIWNLGLGLFLFAFLRSPSARLALAAAFCVGAVLSPLPPAIVNATTSVDGVYTVTSVPTLRTGGGAAFLADGQDIRLEVLSPTTVPVLGDEVLIQGDAKPLPQERARTYLDRGISGIVPGRSTRVSVVQHTQGPAAWGAAWRESFVDYSRRRLSPADSAVANALAFDVATDMSPELRTSMEQSGTAHVLASSGLHLLAIAWILELALGRVPLPLLVRRTVILGTIFLYSAAAGFHPGTFRALVGTALKNGALVFGREYDALSAVALAGVLYLLWRPNMVFDAGFQLSVVIGAGLALFRTRSVGSAPFSRLVKGSAVGWLVSVPIVAQLFGIVSLVSIPANLLAVALLPVCLLGLLASHAASFISTAASDVLLIPATLAAHGLEAVVTGFGSFRWWGFSVPAFSGYWLAAIYSAGFAAWRPKARPVT